MPTQFNTKDSGRRTESLTAMTTHALQNDRFISARMHRKQRHKPALNDTARLSAPCKKQQQQQPHFYPKRIVKARVSNKTLRAYLAVPGSKSSHVPSLILVCYGGYYYYSGHRYVSASAMLLSVRGGLCGPVRYIRAVEESE
ncbi:hypothetical protein ABVT39_015905 [Epinephelus coioides]